MKIANIIKRIKKEKEKINKKNRFNKVINFAKNNDFDSIRNFSSHEDIYRLKDYNIDLYNKVYDYIEENNINTLPNKIKIGFVLYSSTMWSCGELFDLFKSNNIFEPYIIVGKYNNDTRDFSMFNSTCDFFYQKNFPLLKEPNNLNDFNILIYLTPYDCFINKKLNLSQISSTCLTIYIAYSYMLINAPEKFNDPGMSMTWKHYCDSPIYRDMLINYRKDNKKRTFFLGYPKMDEMYEPLKENIENIWKHPNLKTAKKIIYAPHHSLPGCDTISHFSTFDKNYDFIYNLAKNNPQTAWIYKPHPNLSKNAVKSGLFKDRLEYDKYVDKWNNLPNGKVVTDGTYYDIFKSSDLLIGDSISFLAEYQFVHKPLILLELGTQKMTDLGEKLLDIIYRVPGHDLNKIEIIFNDIIKNNKDILAVKRMEYFDKYLNFRKNNNENASLKIYKDICRDLGID